MKNSGSTRGLTVREWMQGYFSRQVAERAPRREQMERYFRGERLGREEGSSLSYELMITVDDLDHYTADPMRRARLEGVVTAPTLSSAPLQVEEGTFHLFIPDPEEPETRLMTYGMVLRDPASGSSYYYDGFKVSRRGPVRLYRGPWADTSLMFFTLHEGETSAAPLLGTGVARMTLPQFLRQIGSMRIQDAPGPVAYTSEWLRFSSWFLAEFYRIYGWRFIFPGWRKRHAREV